MFPVDAESKQHGGPFVAVLLNDADERRSMAVM